MNNEIVVDSLEKLKPFLNKENVMEIVVRQENKRIRAFQKVVLSNLPKDESKEMLEKALHKLNENIKINEKSLKLFGSIAKRQNFGLLLNSANLCATCAGFAIMYEKLDKMSAEISQQIRQVEEVIKEGLDVQVDYEFNKVLANHTDMLDCRRKQQPYSEEKMRELVDSEYNVLAMLVRVFQKGVSADNGEIIFAVFSLLSMMTVSIRFFDELYYFNNHQVLGDNGVWHSSHKKWMGIYVTLSSEWFIERLQDYATFETTLNTLEVDAYYIGLLDQVLDLRQEIEDNQELIVALGNIDLLHSLSEIENQEIVKKITEAFNEANISAANPETGEVYESALKQSGLA